MCTTVTNTCSFSGTNFGDMNDFDAEVELYMGEEGEKYIITVPTIVYVPARMIHCPLNFTRINKPVFFFHTRDGSLKRRSQNNPN